MRFLLALPLLLAFLGCEKPKGPVAVPIGFLPEVTLTPSARTMRRGDTLWLEANFSDSLLDKNSGRRYRVRPQDVSLRSFITFQRLLGVDQSRVGVAPSFRLIERMGRAAVKGSLTASFEPEYDGRRYRARIGLVPTQAGVTAISLLITPAEGTSGFGRFLPFISLPADPEGREQKAVLDDSFYVINAGKANNFDLYARYTRAFAAEPSAPAVTVIFEQQSTFTVEVQ